MKTYKLTHTAIVEGSWFVLYAVNSSPGFRCDLEITVAPHLTIILDDNRFERLRKQGADIREKLDGNLTMRLTPYCFLTVSSAQAEEFFKAHDCISSRLGRIYAGKCIN